MLPCLNNPLSILNVLFQILNVLLLNLALRRKLLILPLHFLQFEVILHDIRVVVKRGIDKR